MAWRSGAVAAHAIRGIRRAAGAAVLVAAGAGAALGPEAGGAATPPPPPAPRSSLPGLDAPPARPQPISQLDAAAAALALAGEARLIGMRHHDGRTRLALSLPGPGPWRVFALDGPPRLIVDVAAGGWTGRRAPPPPGGLIAGLRAGMAEAGRARLALDLAGPARLEEAVMTPLEGGGARLRVILGPETQARFAETAGWPPGARASGGPGRFSVDLRGAPDPRAEPRPLVMVDAGHGGFDPGAIRGDAVEKTLALDFARDLARALQETGRWRAELTRTDDRYLGLDARVELAEAAGASAFVSIHANTVARGEALGASVFSLASRATDAETGALASSENQADLRGPEGHDGDADGDAGAVGAGLRGGDDIAAIIEQIGRGPATLASRGLAEALADNLDAVTPMLRGRAHAQARFRVLRSTRMASALVELGFLSNPADLARMRDPAWRRLAARALAAGLDAWREAGAARAYASAPAPGSGGGLPSGPDSRGPAPASAEN